MANGLFTAREIRALQPRDEGRLTLRIRPSGLKEFYYRKRRQSGGDQTIRIGRFEQPPGQGESPLSRPASS